MEMPPLLRRRFSLACTVLICGIFAVNRPVLADPSTMPSATTPSATMPSATLPSATLHSNVTDVAPAWAGHAVGFCLLTHGNKQFVGFYDADRELTVAQRTLDSSNWTLTRLGTHVEWDSHNTITMALDRRQFLHVSGNMHAVPLIYYRSTAPLDSSTLKPINRMTGELEKRVTYPSFFKGPGDELVFCYRDGVSGSGNNIFNVYSESDQTWARLLDQPLMDGRGKMNAYMTADQHNQIGPQRGPDGRYHVAWVWRDTPMAETCHDLSYIRSADLVHWESASGKPVTLPVTAGNKDVIVDPVPSHGGITNFSPRISFYHGDQLAITYYKYDSGGNTQLYFARPSQAGWSVTQASNWAYRWDFGGPGSLPPPDVTHSALLDAGGKLYVRIHHIRYGTGCWEVDPKTFWLTNEIADPNPDIDLPPRMLAVTSKFPGMHLHRARDLGDPPPGRQFILRWEALDTHRDQPYPPPWPQPSMLQVVEVDGPSK